MGQGYSSGGGAKAERTTIIVPTLEREAEKRCPGCGEYRTLKDGFYRNVSRFDGVSSLCKICTKEQEMARYWRRQGVGRDGS